MAIPHRIVGDGNKSVLETTGLAKCLRAVVSSNGSPYWIPGELVARANDRGGHLSANAASTVLWKCGFCAYCNSFNPGKAILDRV